MSGFLLLLRVWNDDIFFFTFVEKMKGGSREYEVLRVMCEGLCVLLSYTR